MTPAAKLMPEIKVNSAPVLIAYLAVGLLPQPQTTGTMRTQTMTKCTSSQVRT
jgi:hypothetical protein